jgi:hypothetical protein
MERRVIGLVLVLVAMLLTAVSVSTRMWWKANRGSREVAVGTFSLEVCRTRIYGSMAGQHTCESRVFEGRGRDQTFMMLGFATTGAAALANLCLLITAIAAGTRKALPIGWLGLVSSLIFLGASGAFVSQAPEELANIGMGVGAYMAFAAAVLGAAGSVIVATSPPGAPAVAGPPVAMGGGYPPPGGGYGPPPSAPGYPGAPQGAPPGYGPPGGGYPPGGSQS